MFVEVIGLFINENFAGQSNLKNDRPRMFTDVYVQLFHVFLINYETKLLLKIILHSDERSSSFTVTSATHLSRTSQSFQFLVPLTNNDLLRAAHKMMKGSRVYH